MTHRPSASEITDDQLDALYVRVDAAEQLLRQYVGLAAVTHKYRIMGGHDSVGANHTCAGCQLAADATAHLEATAAGDHFVGTDKVIKDATCPPDCAEGHRYEGNCLLDPLNPEGIGYIAYLGSGHGMWAWGCEGDERLLLCTGEFGSNHDSAAAARRAHDRHVRAEHAEPSS
jgi:hypothetical protein